MYDPKRDGIATVKIEYSYVLQIVDKIIPNGK